MTAVAERRCLQIVIALASLVPLAAGAMGILRGPEMISGIAAPVPVDLDSHYRYLSGLLLGIGIIFAVCIPRVERHGPIMRAVGALVIMGGLARLVALAENGPPGSGHLFGLGMELGVVPLILLWQARVARRYDA